MVLTCSHSDTFELQVTVKEQQEWKIPPCISNWKNVKGYTIPLDKRLAADGRGLQGVHINENFAKFAEALYIADRKVSFVRLRNLSNLTNYMIYSPVTFMHTRKSIFPTLLNCHVENLHTLHSTSIFILLTCITPAICMFYRVHTGLKNT